MLTTVGSALSGVIAVAITLMGARYLLDPRPAAAGFGIPGEIGETRAESGRLRRPLGHRHAHAHRRRVTHRLSPRPPSRP